MAVKGLSQCLVFEFDVSLAYALKPHNTLCMCNHKKKDLQKRLQTIHTLQALSRCCAKKGKKRKRKRKKRRKKKRSLTSYLQQ